MHTTNKIFDEANVLSPYKELVAYEYLWSEQGSSYKKMAEKLTNRNRLPSEIIKEEFGFIEPPNFKIVEDYIQQKIGHFSIMLKENFQYPQRLLDAKYPIDLFYYKGDLDLLDKKSISIVGTRNISEDGIRRTKKITSILCRNDFTIVSGLARGVDTVALNTAMESGSNVIGVIGTPIDEFYPKENKDLQIEISKKHLLISQVPFYKYKTQPFKSKRIYFPERNITMSAITHGTIIIEASETSGTLTQARACLAQGRKLFILNSCFENKNITWPKRFEAQGAIRVNDIDDILGALDVDVRNA